MTSGPYTGRTQASLHVAKSCMHCLAQRLIHAGSGKGDEAVKDVIAGHEPCGQVVQVQSSLALFLAQYGTHSKVAGLVMQPGHLVG